MTDEQLIAELNGKDDDIIFGELIEKYKPIVRIIARRYYLLGGELEDLVQEGTIGLYYAIKNFKEGKNASFKTFASICILRQILTAIKKASRQKNKALYQTVSCDFFDDVLTDNIGDYHTLQMYMSCEQNPEEKAISKEHQIEIKEYIKKNLTLLEKKILAEYLNGYSYEIIAKKLQLNKKSVDNALLRIRNKLLSLKI